MHILSLLYSQYSQMSHFHGIYHIGPYVKYLDSRTLEDLCNVLHNLVIYTWLGMVS